MHSKLAMRKLDQELSFAEKLTIPPLRFIDSIEFEDLTSYDSGINKVCSYTCNIYKLNFFGNDDMIKIKHGDTQLYEWWDSDTMNNLLRTSETDEKLQKITPDTL